MSKKKGLFGLAALLALIGGGIGISAGAEKPNIITPEPEPEPDPYIPPPVDEDEPEPIIGELFEENVITPIEAWAEKYPKIPEWTEIPYIPPPVIGELFEEAYISPIEYAAEEYPLEGPGVVPYEPPPPVVGALFEEAIKQPYTKKFGFR